MVVSERGEQWSPKIPADTTAPMVRRILPPIATAMGMAIGIMMEKVPQLVPVQKAIKEPIRKTIAGQKAPLIESPIRLARNWPVPKPGVKFCVSDFRQSQEWCWKAGQILA